MKKMRRASVAVGMVSFSHVTARNSTYKVSAF